MKGITVTPLERAWLEYSGEEIPPHHGWVKVRCAAHSERRPSASVNVDLGKWRCYAGCGRGDVFDLIGIREHVDEFIEQKQIATERFGWEPEGDPVPTAMNPNPRRHSKRDKKPWKPPWL